MSFKAKLLTIFGDIKLQWWPPFIYYEPGDYYKVTGKDTATILKGLREGDILARGYDNYLDGKFIPGKYSHTGVYIGNGEVVHAVSSGVEVTSVIDFCRCDRLAVIRPQKHWEAAVSRLKGWVGKPYDFDFAPGDEAFYCHELCARAYEGCFVPKITPYLGFIRFFTMEPKYLAESFLKSPDFKVLCEI